MDFLIGFGVNTLIYGAQYLLDFKKKERLTFASILIEGSCYPLIFNLGLRGSGTKSKILDKFTFACLGFGVSSLLLRTIDEAM